MLLIALLLFCQVIDDLDMESLREDAKLPNKIIDDILHMEESLNQGKIFETNAAISTTDESSGTLPPLVPFEFPPDFYEKQGRQIVEAVEEKMAKFFGTSHVNKMKNFDTADGMLEYLSNMDFNNSVVNYIVQKCISHLKPTEKLPMEGIADKKACKTACRKNFSASISFVHQMFQNFISQVTDEDLRFRIYQNPKKGYEYSFNAKNNEHFCKCLEKGYQLKVSPTLLGMINRKINSSNGSTLAEEMKEDSTAEDLTTMGNNFSLRKIGNLALYFSGLSSNTNARTMGAYDQWGYRKDPVDFLVQQLIIDVLLLIFCPCLWHFHIIYVIIVFIAEYVLP